MNRDHISELLKVAKELSAAKMPSRMKTLFEPLLEAHDSALKIRITKEARAMRTGLRKKFKSDEEVIEAHRAAQRAVDELPRRERYRNRDFKLDKDLKMWKGWGFGEKAVYDASKFKNSLDRIIEDSIKFNRAKLENAIEKNLGKLPIKAVDEVYSRRGAKGLQGKYLITLKRNVKGHFETQSIPAGGYNIQRFHYRYIMKIDKSLIERAKKIPDAVDPKILEVLTVLAKYKTHLKPREPIPSKIQYKVEALKGASRNWGPLMKAGLVQKVEYGNYYIKRYNYFISIKGFAALKKV